MTKKISLLNIAAIRINGLTISTQLWNVDSFEVGLETLRKWQSEIQQRREARITTAVISQLDGPTRTYLVNPVSMRFELVGDN